MSDEDRYEHYEIVKRADGRLWELGRGGISVTYKAYDTHLHRPVALKVMNAVCIVSETARHRFLDEARAAGALRNQNVASVFHLGMDHDNYFYAMAEVSLELLISRVRNSWKNARLTSGPTSILWVPRFII